VTPQRQSEFTDGTQGDCLRAAVASVLNLPLIAVPHFVILSGGEWHKGVRDWLRDRGLDFRLVYSAPRGYAVAIGPIRDGKGYHAVVERDGELAHDPNGGKGLDKADAWLVIERIDYEMEAIKARRLERARNGWRS
jgi:hypothetical protein